MTHGIYTAWNQWDEPQILWNFFKKLYEMSDSIWVDTFANVQEYIKERDETKISVHEDKNVFTVTLDCPLDSNLFDIPLTLKIDKLPQSSSVKVIQDGKAIATCKKSGSIIADINPHGGPITIKVSD